MRTPADGLRESGRMVENLIFLILAAALMIYLFICLLKPEKF
jgi:K+-transporting ATPase KdpF subunit